MGNGQLLKVLWAREWHDLEKVNMFWSPFSHWWDKGAGIESSNSNQLTKIILLHIFTKYFCLHFYFDCSSPPSNINYLKLFFFSYFPSPETLVLAHHSGNGLRIHSMLGKNCRNFIFLTPWCDVISGPGQLVHLIGKDEVEWHSVLGRQGQKLGSFLCLGSALKEFSFPSSDE